MDVARAELTPRRRQILRALIEEHIASAAPVSSEAIVTGHGLNVSSATVRNELAVLEELGLIYQPHTSSGRVPSQYGYRYFVENLMGERPPSPEEQRTIQHQFYQVELQMQEWLRLAVSILARGVQNAAFASATEIGQARLRHVELVLLHETAALLVLVTRHATVSQQVLALAQPTTQEELSMLAGSLRGQVAGLSGDEIRALPEPQTWLERTVRLTVVEQLTRQDRRQGTQLYHDGLANLLSQPEYSRLGDQRRRQERMRAILDVVERGDVVLDLLPHVLESGTVQVLIGEQRLDAVRDCAIILAPYGGRQGTAGVIGVVGPTRMDYARTLGVLRYVSSLLSVLTDEVEPC